MPLREFTDADGHRWSAWTTRPALRGGVPMVLQDGWLTFECGPIRKRLAPIPRDWEESSTARMRLYCSIAQEMSPTRRSNPGEAQAED
jgi:hypothetical protein